MARGPRFEFKPGLQAKQTPREQTPEHVAELGSRIQWYTKPSTMAGELSPLPQLSLYFGNLTPTKEGLFSALELVLNEMLPFCQCRFRPASPPIFLRIRT
jgi:hypothetical protein